MNPDQELIESAYADAIKKLYAALFDKYTQGGGDAAQEQAFDEAFTTGVAFARKARDRAKALLA
jgi:hypothetical protein